MRSLFTRQLAAVSIAVIVMFMLSGGADAQSLSGLAGVNAQTLSELQAIAHPPGGTQDVPALLNEKAIRDTSEKAAKDTATQTNRAILTETATQGISRLEQDYTLRLSKTIHDRFDQQMLRQFGYGALANRQTTPETPMGASTDGYRLGIGDEIVVNMRGQHAATLRAKVDREGRIILPDLEPITASGRTFGDVRTELADAAERLFSQTKVFVSLGSVRGIGVYVLGEVGEPGLHRLNGLSNIMDALTAAGGPTKGGTLRHIIVTHGGTQTPVDLYEMLLNGHFEQDIPLADGDRIFVGPIGTTVAVTGEVYHSAIFELKPGQKTISGPLALEMAGGKLRAVNYEVMKVGAAGGSHDVAVTAKSPDQVSLGNGDILMLVQNWNSSVGSFSLDGDVVVPGVHPLEGKSSLSALLSDPNVFGPNPYLLFAVLLTPDRETQTPRMVPVDLSRIIDGTANLPLKKDDRLIVFSADDIRYLNSADVQTVMKKGTIANSCPALNKLANSISSTRHDRFANAFQAPNSMSCPAIFIKYPDLLTFMVDYASIVQGEINSPGPYPVLPNTPLSRILAVAGGVVYGADLTRIELSRIYENDEDRKVYDARAINPQQVAVRPGDIISLTFDGFSIEGNIMIPGMHLLPAKPMLSAVLADPKLFKENPYLLFAVLLSTDPETRSTRMIPVDLTRVMDGSADMVLRHKDRLVVFSADDIRYLNSADVQAVIGGGKLALQEKPTELSILKNQTAQTPNSPQSTNNSPQSTNNSPNFANNSSPFVNTCAGLQKLAVVIDTTRRERFANAFQATTPDGLEKTLPNQMPCPAVFNANPDLLAFVLDYATVVQGEANSPGPYPVLPNTPLSKVLAVAGGIARGADLSKVEVSRYSENAEDRKLYNAIDPSTHQVAIDPGDIIHLIANVSSKDTGPIVLRGEVRYPGVYTIRRGEKLSEAINQAGGLTAQSYPLGAVFLRTRLRQQEQANNDIAARRLEASLTTTSSGKTDAGTPPIVAIQTIAQSIRNAPAAGRSVIECDPTVLQLRPELDTVLEPGDELVVPKRPNHVAITGEVLMPSNTQFNPELDPSDYIKMAGGFTQQADKDRAYVILPNGMAEPLAISSWNFTPTHIPPGSTIVVPRDLTPFDPWALTTSLSQVVSQIAISAASLAVISHY
ncbi:MAG: SLBB domain-containing protein [Alphaproteobacteria bacterium]|nr:SLBB domain-containing protein [Alphaproteobacteria bacterium]